MRYITSPQLDEVYPAINMGNPFIQMGLLLKIEDHLSAARQGNRDRESRLINRLGSMRRSGSFKNLVPDLQRAVKEAIEFLRSKGRKVDFSNENPAMWITTRERRARW